MGRITAIFDTVRAAQEARDALVHEGLDADGIALSPSQTADGVAGEAPGQSYENQAGQTDRDSAVARYGTAIRSGTCALTFDAAAANSARLTQLLASRGARQIVTPPR